MAFQYKLETPWDDTPDATSTFEIYDVEDQWLFGNGVDNTQKFDLTTFTDLLGDAPKGDLLRVYKFRLMIAGDPAFPHRIWYSHIRNGEGWSRDNDWIDIYPQDGGSINGMSVQNDELIISKSNGRKYGWRIHVDGDPVNSRLRIIEDDKGNVSKKAETILENFHYFLDRNGLYSVPQAPRGGISHIVQQVIDGIPQSNLDNVAMGSNNGKVYMSLGDITVDVGDTVSLTSAVLVYDTVERMFYLRDQVPANVFTRFINSDNEEDLYFGTSEGIVFKLDDGSLAGSAPIHMQIRTKPYFRELGRHITVSKVGIHMNDPDNTTVNYRTNENEEFQTTLGRVTQSPVQWFEPQDAKGPLFQMEFTHSNSSIRPTLLGYTFFYHVEGKKDDN